MTEVLVPAETTMLVLPLMLIEPEAHTTSPVLVQLVTLSSLFSTEITAVDGFLEVVQAVAPASDVTPLASVKSSSQIDPVLLMLVVTLTVAVLVHPVAGLVTVKLYGPIVVTTGFCAAAVKLFGPVQLYVIPEVEEEPERVTEDVPVQESVPLALAQAPGPELFGTTWAVPVPLQPVPGLKTSKV